MICSLNQELSGQSSVFFVLQQSLQDWADHFRFLSKAMGLMRKLGSEKDLCHLLFHFD